MAKRLRDFKEVIGQKNIVRWFASAIERDRIPQVIMLTGPAGTGKTSVASIAACEIACKNKPSMLEETKDAVIENKTSTECVRIYNMSNLKSQEKVEEVKADLQVGFSPTGRKVIIMDEAQGMSAEAQNSLLTIFEALPKGVYILICTTALEHFETAFLSRVLLRRFTCLSGADMRMFIKSRIEENDLRFTLSENLVVNLIAMYTEREPRRAINLLDSFEPGSTVTEEDLDSFFNVREGNQLVTLIKYLYSGSVLQGIDFINEFEMGPTFQSTLIELLRIAQGGQSNMLSKAMADELIKVTESNINRLIAFVSKCTTHRVTRNLLIGYFLECCAKKEMLSETPKPINEDKVRMENMSNMGQMLTKTVPVANKRDVGKLTSFEAMLANSEVLE